MRIAEEPLTRIPELTRAVSAAIADLVQPPVAFFGHSMGALLAYEVARSLLDGGMAPVRHLAVAAYPAPHLSLASRGLHRLDDAALLRSVATLGGMPPGVLLSHHHALLELLLPAIRADLEACETYQHATGPPLPCPITAYAGTADDLVPSWSMRQWDRYATGGFAFRAIDGGHFFPVSHQDELLGDLAHLLLGKGPAIYAPGH
jgi:surfactin synthase thioesterase subunit